MDALSDAGAWEDDARVVELSATKAYKTTESGIGAVIQIAAVGAGRD